MSKLYLLRHAKAGWALPGMRDFDRPLDASGVADAETIGAVMRACDYVPDLTLCSNAKRARETLEGVAGHTDTGRVLFLDTLYSEDAAGYLDLIRGNGGPRLAARRRPQPDDGRSRHRAFGRRRRRLRRGTLNPGFPTSGLAVVRFPGSLAERRARHRLSRSLPDAGRLIL